MKFDALIGANLSGSMGGITASHNKQGSYFRQRSAPVQPNTPAQTQAKAAFGAASQMWKALTPPLKAGWKSFALAKWKNRFGTQSGTATGSMAYQAMNTAVANAFVRQSSAFFTLPGGGDIQETQGKFEFNTIPPLEMLAANIQSGLGVLTGTMSLIAPAFNENGNYSFQLMANGLPSVGTLIPGLVDGNGIPFGFSTYLSGPVSDPDGFIKNKTQIYLESIRSQMFDPLLITNAKLIEYTALQPIDLEAFLNPPLAGEYRLFSLYQVSDNGMMNFIGSKMIQIEGAV